MDRVCCVLLLSVLLAAAVSPGRAAPVSDQEWIEGTMGPSEEDEWEDMVEGKIGEDDLLTKPQNSSQLSLPGDENFQAEWTNVNITQEESDYDNGDSQEKEYESEDPWWEEDDDWMGAKSEADKAKEEGESETDKLLWETWPVTDKFWWEPKSEDGKSDSVGEEKMGEEKMGDEKMGEEDQIPWWWGGGITARPPMWGRPELKPNEEKGEMKVDEKKSKPEEPQWWAWAVTKKPWWGVEEKAEEPWWEVDANENIPQDKAWFPTKTQDEDKERLDDSDDFVEELDVYIGNDEDTRDDLEEIPVQQEIFPPEMKENTITLIHEKWGSVYFWAFLATLAILVTVLVVVYHKKRLSQQRRFIFALEGGLFGDNKRPKSGEYQRLENKI